MQVPKLYAQEVTLVLSGVGMVPPTELPPQGPGHEVDSRGSISSSRIRGAGLLAHAGEAP